MKIDDSALTECLFFNANRFARAMTKLAEQAFVDINLSPIYAYLLILVAQYPNITQKKLCEKLDIAPSTSTRFINKLEDAALVTRTSQGKETHIHLTDSGYALQETIEAGFDRLSKAYQEKIGEKESALLAKMLYESSEILKEE